MRWVSDTRSSLGARLRTLSVLGVVAAVAVALVAETTLQGSGIAPSWLHPGDPSLTSGSMSPPLGDPAEPGLALAKPHKGHKQKADKKGKHKQDNDKGKKKHKHKGNNGKHKGSKQGKHHRNEKGRGQRGSRNQRHELRAAGDITAATSITLAPMADGLVLEVEPAARYGSAARLLVDGGGNDPDAVSYLRFDVSGVNAPVQRVLLRLWVQPNGGTADGPEIYATGLDWSEKDLTWDTRPGPSGAGLDDAGRLTGSTWADFDVTAAVGGDGPVAFLLLPQTDDGAVFDSRETSNPPQLVITLEEANPTPTLTPDPTPTSVPEPTSTPTPDPTSTPTPDPTSTPLPAPTPTPEPSQGVTLLAAGDIASCSSNGDEATSALLDGLTGTVITLGDNVYSAGTVQEFAQCFDPSWGRHKSRTRPIPGNHDYQTSGAAGYFGYFGVAAGIPLQGYYSYDLGGWHIVALNSNCSRVGGCGEGSPQEQWLRQDLAAHPAACTLAYWHHPRFSFGKYGNNTATRALWQVLDEHGAEVVLTGHDHNYQRYALQDADGMRDPAGIRQFVVGTGGKSHYALGTPPSNVEAYNGDTYGVLQLTLHDTGYDWTFIPVAGKSFTDSGSDICH